VLQIGVSYTPVGGGSFNIVFDQFLGADLPRTYQQGASFSKSANGASIIQGSAYRQKYIWAISAVVTTAVAIQVRQMFEAWDTDRAAGYGAAIGIADTTFGATVSTSAVISTPPTFNRISPTHFQVSFGLTEV